MSIDRTVTLKIIVVYLCSTMADSASLYKSSSDYQLPTYQHGSSRLQDVGTLSFIHVGTNTRGLSGIQIIVIAIACFSFRV